MTKRTSLRLLLVFLVAMAAPGCGADDSGLSQVITDAGDAGRDAAIDGGNRDAGLDAGRDAGLDAATDAGLDAGHDAGLDASNDDAGIDAGLDAGHDAATDSGVGDAAADSGVGDAAADSGVGDAAADSGVGDGGSAAARCLSADVLTAATQATFTVNPTTGSVFASGSGCAFGPGAERAFAVDVPSGKRLYSSVRGIGIFDPTISLVDGAATCAATGGSCLASDDTGSAESLNFVTRTNTSGSTARYLVLVDGTANVGGQFEFRTVVSDPLVGETCLNAVPIALNAGAAVRSGDTVDLYANDYATGVGCSGFNGGERVYRIDVPAETTLAIDATPSAAFDVALNIIEGATTGAPEGACAAAFACAASGNVGIAGEPERVTYRNAALTPRTIFVTVEAATSTTVPGTFNLAVSTLGNAIGDTCAAPPSVVFANDTATLTGEPLGNAADDYGPGAGCAGTAGPERAFALRIPAGRRLTATVISTGSSAFNPSLNIVDAAACAYVPRECLASSDTFGSSDSVAYTNASLVPLDVVVFVESGATTVPASATFGLTVTLSDPPAGDTCTSAPAVGASTLSGQTLTGYADDAPYGSGCEDTAGPDRFYRVTVPSGQELTARVTPQTSNGSAAWDASINVQFATACDPRLRECLTGSNFARAGGVEEATWANRSAASVDVFVVVEALGAPTPGAALPFTLGVTLSTAPAIPVGDVCVTAPTVSAGNLTNQALADYSNDFGDGAGCFGTAGPDRLYRVLVPAGQRLTATVTPRTSGAANLWDSAINLEADGACGATPRVCIAGDDTGAPGEIDRVRWTNTGATTVAVFVVIETAASGAPPIGDLRVFDLALAIATPPAAPTDDVCADGSPLLSSNATFPNESLEAYSGDYEAGSASCATVSNASGGVDRAYRVRIPAGRTLTATVTPDAAWDPTLSLVAGNALACASTPLVCVGGADLGSPGEPETLQYANTSAAAIDGFLVLDSWTPATTTAFPYSLSVTFTP